jgi:hypothetical protein
MSTETVPVEQEKEPVIEAPVEQAQESVAEAPEAPAQEEEQKVPLSALQKERRKRQEIEQELRWHKEQNAPKPQPQEPDESRFEAVTKEELGTVRKQIKREFQEEDWVKENPEKAEEVNERLAEFLKQRPNLAPAIEGAVNRYSEAWTLMNALSPKQKAALKPSQQRKDAPGSPAAVPKAAALNQVVDFSNMSDEEFNAWRKGKRKKR